MTGRLKKACPGNRLFSRQNEIFSPCCSVQNNRQFVEIRPVDEPQQVNKRFAVQGSSLAFTPDGSLLAVSGAQLTLFDINANGEPAWSIDSPSPRIGNPPSQQTEGSWHYPAGTVHYSYTAFPDLFFGGYYERTDIQ